MFSNLAEISMLAALCMTGLTVGTAVALVGGKNSNRTSAIVGTAICIVSMMGFISLDEPFADAQKKEAESGTEYKAVHQDEIKSFVNCYKENGYNVCETKDKKEMVVDHYWKKGESKKKKKKGKQALKYKGIKDTEIKKYTSCKNDEGNKVCIAEDGTKEKVDTYWKIGGKE